MRPASHMPLRSEQDELDKRFRLSPVLLLGLAWIGLTVFDSQSAEPDGTKLPPPATVTVDFVKDIQPMLAQRCYECHGSQRAKNELRWDVKQLALKGGTS